MDKAAINDIRRVLADTKGKKSQNTSLQINGIKICTLNPSIKSLIEQYHNLRVLCLTDCSLTSLQHLPNLSQLEQIDLTSNKLEDSEIKHLRKYKKLRIVNLAHNCITDPSIFEEFKGMNIEQLELYQNPIAEEEKYRQLLFQRIPTLRILDERDKLGTWIDDEDYEDDVIMQEEDAEESVDWDKEGPEQSGADMMDLFDNDDFGFGPQDMDEEEEQQQMKKSAPPKATAKRGRKNKVPKP